MRLRLRISEEGTHITLIPSGQTREKSELLSWVSWGLRDWAWFRVFEDGAEGG